MDCMLKYLSTIIVDSVALSRDPGKTLRELIFSSVYLATALVQNGIGRESSRILGEVGYFSETLGP